MGLSWRRKEVFLVVVLLATVAGIQATEEKKKDVVIALDPSNFNDIVAKHDLIVVEFFAPWCGYCKKLAPEYEKAAVTLSKHDPPITLAKIDLSIDSNKKHFQNEFKIRGFPTLKIIRNGGKLVHTVENTPQSADGIVQLVKTYLAPASVEIVSVDVADKIIDKKKTFIAGVFPKFEGEEYENFTKLADTLRSEYGFGHTLDAKVLPRGDSSVKGPVIRLLKPFDELFADFKNFDLEALKKFIEEEDLPSVVTFNRDPRNTYAQRIFQNQNIKIFMFMDLKSKNASAIKSRFHDVAVLLKGGNKFFLIGDVDSEEGKELLEFLGLEKSHIPILFIFENEATKYITTNVEPDQFAPWFRKYMDGKLELFMKSQPIPKENNAPVKEVVYNSLSEMVLNSGKDVFLMFYSAWCRDECKKLAPILNEIAISYENDSDITIAKFDSSANDVPRELFNIKDKFPILFFVKKNQEIVEYNGGMTKEDLTNFIEEQRSDKKSKIEPEIESVTEKASDDLIVDEIITSKDEL